MPRIRIPITFGLALIIAGVVAVAPAAAQDDAYQAALEAGDLTLLVPEAFTEADMTTELSFEGALGPPEIDTPEAADARAALLRIIAEAGLTPDDVMTLNGFHGVDTSFTSFTATRIPGVAATEWFEPFYQVAMSRNYGDPGREVIEVGPKQVLRISSRGSDRSDLLYAQGEVLWVLSGDDDLGTAFLEGLATIDGPALQADPGAPADGDQVTVIGTPEDPLSQIPPEILGAETTTQTFPVSAVLDGVDMNDADAAAQANALRSLLDPVGGPDRATLISSQARTDDGGIVILGLHVDGADQAVFRQGFLDLYLGPELDSPVYEDDQLGGKAVTRVSQAARPTRTEAWVYGVGGTVWVLLGDDEYITALLRTMP
jgi:hypothetical protein